MEYISMGTAMEQSSGNIIRVSHCGQKFRLAGEKASLWQKGRYGFAAADGAAEYRILKELTGMGLAVQVGAERQGRYRALTGCVICPVGRLFPYMGLSGKQRTAMRWLSKAGLCLTMAELVYLTDRGIKPVPSLLEKGNRQALVETIYTRETVFDNLLENEMAKAAACDETVETVEGLLKAKRIILL